MEGCGAFTGVASFVLLTSPLFGVETTLSSFLVGATKKVAADKLKEERKNEEQKKKRSRVAPTKKEDKVFFFV